MKINAIIKLAKSELSAQGIQLHSGIVTNRKILKILNLTPGHPKTPVPALQTPFAAAR